MPSFRLARLTAPAAARGLDALIVFDPPQGRAAPDSDDMQLSDGRTPVRAGAHRADGRMTP